MPDSQARQGSRDERRSADGRKEGRGGQAERAALLNVERAARELDALFDGEPTAWTLDGQLVSDDTSAALLSLHDYLNDVAAARTCICGNDEAEDDRSAVLRCPIHGPAEVDSC